MKIIPTNPLARTSDPDTSHEAGDHMRSTGKERNEMDKVLLVYYKTGKEMNSWEMLGQSQGTLDPDSNYWHRCTDLRKTGELELVLNPWSGQVVKRPGRTGRAQQVYRITPKGERVARDLILGT